MDTQINTEESVKVMLPITEVQKLRKALPVGAINRIADELRISYQLVTYAFNKILIRDMSKDGKSTLVRSDVIQAAVRIIRETGNSSFDHLQNLQ